ncbi:hypothetical protein ACXIUS_14550 [Bosea thiooxidans]
MAHSTDTALKMTSSISDTIGGTSDSVCRFLTETSTPNAVFIGAPLALGEQGELFRLLRDDGWLVTGEVLAKQPPSRLCLSWKIKTPASMDMPNIKVEFIIAPSGTDGEASTLTITGYADGPIPMQYVGAGRAGWAMMLRRAVAAFS